MNLLMSSRLRRTAPRIISRSYEKLRRVEGSDSAYDVPTDVEREVQSEIYMKGGVAVSVSGAAAKAAAAAATARHSASASAESDGASPRSDAGPADGFVELPGVANEVESYPCPICTADNKVFLTVAGLERHAREAHPERASSVDAHAARIQNEWRRRRIIGAAGTGGSTGDNVQVGSPVILMPVSQNRLSEICRRCGYAVSVDTPGAMDYHIEAHKKNDELRKQLVEEYGERFVEFVTCKHCALVFADGRALFEHIRSNHKRKNTGFICRWCGKMFTGMAQLNAHKLQAHNIAAHSSAPTVTSQYRQPPSLSSATVNDNEPFLADHSVLDLHRTNESRLDSPIDVDTFDEENGDTFQKIADTVRDVSAVQAPSLVTTQPADYLHDANARILETLTKDAFVDETAPCRTKCEICGLVMIKPSLLVRHMLRVHNQSEFVADVTSRHSAPLKFTVRAGGRVTWHCCDVDFEERNEILMHRQLKHGRGDMISIFEPATASTSSYGMNGEPIVEDDRRNLQHDGVPITGAEVFIETDSPTVPSSLVGDDVDDEFERLFGGGRRLAQPSAAALNVGNEDDKIIVPG